MAIWIAAAVLASGCGNPTPYDAPDPGEGSDRAAPDERSESEPGVAVEPPFPVEGELDGLLLVWFDEKGTHTAARRSEIPEPHRSEVRIDSLQLPPAKRLDPDQVYIADLTRPRADGGYSVTQRSRAWFEARVASARAVPAAASGGVTLYMASWCGACRAAAEYFRARDVPFVEKDIEKDAAAAAEMRRKLRAAGATAGGVPVIDFRGELVLGFDASALDRLIGSSASTTP